MKLSITITYLTIILAIVSGAILIITAKDIICLFVGFLLCMSGIFILTGHSVNRRNLQSINQLPTCTECGEAFEHMHQPCRKPRCPNPN